MRKGQATRENAIGEALAHAAAVGLEAISLGAVAERARLSKSGLFAHFRSKEALQLAVLEEAVQRFARAVVAPALARPRGEPRLTALFRSYLSWIRSNEWGSGCIFFALSQEYDDRPGPIRDRLVRSEEEWKDVLARAAAQAVEEGHFRKDLDPEQVAFELMGVAMAFHHLHKLLGEDRAHSRAVAAFERLLAGWRRSSGPGPGPRSMSRSRQSGKRQRAR